MAPHLISATRAGGMSCRYRVIRRAVELWSRSTFESGKHAFSQERLGDGFDDAQAAMPLTALSATASSSDHVLDPITLMRGLASRVDPNIAAETGGQPDRAVQHDGQGEEHLRTSRRERCPML